MKNHRIMIHRSYYHTAFGQRIKTARLMAGLSQQALADEINKFIDRKKITRTAIAQWESGFTKEIGAGNLLKAAKVLNTTPEWLRYGIGKMLAEPSFLEDLPKIETQSTIWKCSEK
jgi:transcriptional regulator with XRE-family HTH domain